MEALWVALAAAGGLALVGAAGMGWFWREARRLDGFGRHGEGEEEANDGHPRA